MHRRLQVAVKALNGSMGAANKGFSWGQLPAVSWLVLVLAFMGQATAQSPPTTEPATPAIETSSQNTFLNWLSLLKPTSNFDKIEKTLREHISIVNLLYRCRQITTGPNDGDWYTLYGGLPWYPTKAQGPDLKISPDEIQLLTLSREVSSERLDSQASYEQSYSTFLNWSIAAIIFGSLTTLFSAVANSSAEKASKVIRYLAMGLPVCATGVTGYLALISPEASYTSAFRTGTALARLQNELWFDVSSSNCNKNNQLAFASSNLAAYRERLNEIRDAELAPQESKKTDKKPNPPLGAAGKPG